MNAQDRKEIDRILGELRDLSDQVQEIATKVEALGSELRAFAEAEQEKFDNLSEGLQQGERGQAIETAADALSAAADAAEDGNAQEAVEALENIE